MEIPFFIFDFVDGSTFEIDDDHYEMMIDEDTVAISGVEIYLNNDRPGFERLTIGEEFKLCSHSFGVDKVRITNIEYFDFDLVEKFDMKAPLCLVVIEFISGMISGSDYDNIKKLYDRNYKIKKITDNNVTS